MRTASWLLFAGIIALAGCSQRLSREDRYTGTVSPQDGCGTAMRGTLTASGSRFVFAPSDGVILIAGPIAADGALAGQVAPIGADKRPFVMTLAGHIGPERVEGVYATPRCRFTVSLARVHPDLL